MPTLSFIVPCYNEAEILPAVLPRLHAAGQSVVGGYELVLIDDGSTDETWAGIASAARASPGIVRGIRFSRNFGQQPALLAGLAHARGDYGLLVDADLQDPPELAAPMLARAREGYDLVYGVRRSRAGETWPKRATAWVFHRALTLIARRPIPVDSGYFTLLSRKAIDALLALPARDRYFRVLVSLIELPRAPIAYDRAARIGGKSKYAWRQLVAVALHAFASARRRPSNDAHAPLFDVRETAG